MSHLKCRKHDRRVVVLPLSTRHRSDGSKCDSVVVEIAGSILTPDEVRHYTTTRDDVFSS
jgi:hypothetical protein